MITLKKQPDRDFLILNLTDPQLDDEEWDKYRYRHTIETTLNELIERVKPDLITVSGDIAWAGQRVSYKKFADLIDSYGIPWAPVWGNHDNQRGPDEVNYVADLYLSYANCVYEKGDPAMGNGNYVIRIEEDGKPVTGVFMIDSHDHSPWVNEKGEDTSEWAKLDPIQLDWYREQVNALKADGCSDSAIVLHIPIYAYREAAAAAFRKGFDLKAIKPEESYGHACWNEGYTDSFGVMYEGICSYPADEGMMDLICELGSTRHVVCGHDHVNSTVIKYRGVKLIYGLKTGLGCYYNELLNGGTVLKVTKDGVTDVWHESVPIPADCLKKEENE